MFDSLYLTTVLQSTEFDIEKEYVSLVVSALADMLMVLV